MEPISMFVACALPTGRDVTQRVIRDLLSVQDEVSRRLDEFAHELERLRQSSWRSGRELLLEAAADGWSAEERRALTERALERFLDGHADLQGWDRILCAVDASLTYHLLCKETHARRWSLRAYSEGVEFLGAESQRRIEASFDRVDRPGDSLRQTLAKLKRLTASPSTFNRQVVFVALFEDDPDVSLALQTGSIGEDERVRDHVSGNVIASSLMSLYVMESFLDDLYKASTAMGCDMSKTSQMMLTLDLSSATRDWAPWAPE